MLKALITLALALAAATTLAQPQTGPLDGEHHARARDMSARAIAYLGSVQDESGGWAVYPGRPVFPAISGLALNGILLDPRTDPGSELVASARDFILSYARKDGGIHDGVLPTYNTAICVSALSRLPGDPKAATVIRPAVSMLRTTQWGAFDPDKASNPEAPEWNEPVDESHPYFGGAGYGNNNRPDMSNTQFFLQALDDAGVPPTDPAVQRALVFLRRTQMDGGVNPMPYAEGSSQGGFIYATVPNAESIDSVPGQSQAGETEELIDGRRVSRLRAYGSMTYAGFKALAYADLAPDDPRITAASRWITANYTLSENPGLGDDGRYYYYLTFSRALDTLGITQLSTDAGDRNWRHDLIDALAELQSEDGSFRSVSDRWLENDPVLITSYALIALGHASGDAD